MSRRSLQKTLADARKKLELAIRDRERIEVKIAQLKRMIAGMSGFVGGKNQRLPGIDDVTLKGAIRTALRALGKPATIADVRKVLTELNYTDIEQHKNPAASVVNILQRLIADGEVNYGKLRHGKKTYVWMLPVYGAATSLANRLEDHRRNTKRKQRQRERRVPPV